jgi:hypothetical protein
MIALKKTRALMNSVVITCALVACPTGSCQWQIEDPIGFITYVHTEDPSMRSSPVKAK